MQVEFKGKSLETLKAFVDEWSPHGSQGISTVSQKLIELVVGMHPQVLSAADAHQLIEKVAQEEYWKFLGVAPPEEALLLAKPKIISGIKEFVESLPRSYEFRIGLPYFPSWFSGRLDLAEDVQLVADEPHENRILAALMNTDSSRVHLVVRTNGYADHGPSASAARRALGYAHHVIYLMKLFGVAARRYDVEPSRPSFQPYRATDGCFRYTPPALRRICDTLAVAESNLRVVAMDGAGQTLLGKVNVRPPENDQERNAALQRGVSSIADALKLRSLDDYEFLGAAMEWALESEAAENDTVAYILASIGLEAILGTGDYMNEMSKRLGDRYAFLTGRHRSDREKRAEEFKKLLDLRGAIVHARHRGLTYPEMHSLFEIQVRLEECIQAELNELLKLNRPGRAK